MKKGVGGQGVPIGPNKGGVTQQGASVHREIPVGPSKGGVNDKGQSPKVIPGDKGQR